VVWLWQSFFSAAKNILLSIPKIKSNVAATEYSVAVTVYLGETRKYFWLRISLVAISFLSENDDRSN